MAANPNEDLTDRQRAILEFIVAQQKERGFPPSVREIGEAVGLTSPSTVHSHLETLQRRGYLHRDPTKPRAIEVRWDAASGGTAERRPLDYVPLVGDVAAGTDVLAQENIEELVPIPADFTGDGVLFMLRVRGDSMIDKGILDGDYVVVRQQSEAASLGSHFEQVTPGGQGIRSGKQLGGHDEHTLDDMLNTPQRTEHKQPTDVSNPTKAGTGRSSPSAPFSGNRGDTAEVERPSVRRQIKEIKDARRKQPTPSKDRVRQTTHQHTAPSKKNTKGR
jgi:repressor LexA